jgi:hypothetical protein
MQQAEELHTALSQYSLDESLARLKTSNRNREAGVIRQYFVGAARLAIRPIRE